MIRRLRHLRELHRTGELERRYAHRDDLALLISVYAAIALFVIFPALLGDGPLARLYELIV